MLEHRVEVDNKKKERSRSLQGSKVFTNHDKGYKENEQLGVEVNG